MELIRAEIETGARADCRYVAAPSLKKRERNICCSWCSPSLDMGRATLGAL